MSLPRAPQFLILTLNMSLAYSAVLGETHKNVEYTRVGGTPLYMDIQIPQGSGPFPAAIVVHGGGWVRGDRRIDVAPLFQPLTNAGIAWFSIDYRLAADITQFGAAVADVEEAIRYVKSHAADYAIDADRVALIGESAGGQLSAMAALKSSAATGVKAVVAFYTPLDLVELAQSPGYIPEQVRQSFRGTPFEKLVLARLSQLSPIQNVTRDAPPFLLIHGTADRLVPFSQSLAMCERMKAVGASCEVVPVEGAGHGMRWWETSESLEVGSYKKEMVSWLKSKLANP